MTGGTVGAATAPSVRFVVVVFIRCFLLSFQEERV